LNRCFTKMDLFAMGQMGRASYFVPRIGYQSPPIYAKTSLNSTPGLALAAKCESTVYVPLSRDELDIKKVIGVAHPTEVMALEKQINVDVKNSPAGANLKVGAGNMKAEIDLAFSKPIFRVHEKLASPGGPPSKKMKTESGAVSASGSGLQKSKRKTPAGSGLKFA